MLYTKFASTIYLMKAINIMSKWCTEVLRRYPHSDQMLLRRVDAQMMLKDAEMISLKHILNLALAQGLYCGHRLVM